MNMPFSEQVKIENSWKQVLFDEFSLEYMQSLRQFLQYEKQAGKVIYPRASQCFSALNLTPFNKVKVVIWPRSVSWPRSGTWLMFFCATKRSSSPFVG